MTQAQSLWSLALFISAGLAQGQALAVDTAGFDDGASVTVCLRPEKLFFADGRDGALAGRVEERFFLGSQWLYRVSSALVFSWSFSRILVR